MSVFALRLILATVPVGGFLFGSCIWLSAHLSHGAAVRMRDRGMLRRSVCGCMVPTAAVVGVIGAQVATSAAVFGLFGAPPRYYLLPAVTLGFMGVGFYDDFRSVKETRQSAIKGWQGHLTALAGGEITSGALKAAAGGMVALAGVAAFSPSAAGGFATCGLGEILRDATVVALSANAANCLDVKPGRAGKGLVLAWLLLLPFMGYYAVPRLVMASITAAPVIGFLPGDLRGKMMMGDAGANAWGSMWGAAAVLTASPGGRWAILALLLGATAVAETVTFSALIDRSWLLKGIDEWGSSCS